MTERKFTPHTEPKDREMDEFDRDLFGDTDQGINHAQLGTNPEQQAPAAGSLKELHRILPELTKDELNRIVVLQPGDRLEQGAVYIDLATPTRQESKAPTGGIEVGRNNIIIPKQGVDYQLWNRLRGVDNPERTGEADDSSVR